jgi:iron complex outermembrane receptor protein
VEYVRNSKIWVLAIAALLAPPGSWAEEEDVAELETFVAEETVEDDIGIIPTGPIESVFGFDKTLLETPRSASVISIETMEQFGITEIDDLVVLAPGSFTQSFFGAAGALDLRGTPGEVYFNGIRRLENPGNYATPIGAADRVDIIRGPASVISGPSRIGGYLNFVPKSARAETGQYLERPTGEVSYTTGSFQKGVLAAEVGGPGSIGDKEFGYYIYGEAEDSDSYYENTEVKSKLLQATFNIDLNEKSRLSFGGMYYDWESNQVAGWNRLSQDLIDTGLYVTGSPFPGLDVDGDGSISHQEYGGNAGIESFTFMGPSYATAEQFQAVPNMGLDPSTVGTAYLKGSQVLVAPDDELLSESIVLYLDYEYDLSENWSLTNKSYYEWYDNYGTNAYGFSQQGISSVWENQLQLAFNKAYDGFEVNAIISPSYRDTEFERGNDYSNEYFDRRDLTGPSTALDRRLLAVRIDDDYNRYVVGDYSVLGIAALLDLQTDAGVDVLLGVRQDTIDMKSEMIGHKTLYRDDFYGTNEDDAFSWTASITYNSPIGIAPYVTLSEQVTVVASQMADLDPESVADGNAAASSELKEYGVKGSFLNDQLFVQANYYEQERTNVSSQDVVTNQVSRGEGYEIEIRYLVTDALTLTFGYSDQEVTNLTTLADGRRFSFFGASDMPHIDPALIYGGTANGFVWAADSNPKAIRAGIPDTIMSASVIYDFQSGISGFASVTDVASVYSGYSQAVKLPAYTLVNAGIKFDIGNWAITLNGKNLTDERYFRSNFPNLFGSTIVLPELPRHYQVNASFKF